MCVRLKVRLFKGRHFNNNVQSKLTVVIRNSVYNRKPQLKEGDTQCWPISFYHITRRRINILLVECDLNNSKFLFVCLAKLGFPIDYEF